MINYNSVYTDYLEMKNLNLPIITYNLIYVGYDFNFIIRLVKVLYYNISALISTSPAPWNTIVFSESLVFVIRSDANNPATATEAVP